MTEQGDAVMLLNDFFGDFEFELEGKVATGLCHVRCPLGGGDCVPPISLFEKIRPRHPSSLTFSPQHLPPTTYPDDHAHWKLYPPSHPVTSTTSPTKNNPGALFAISVFDDSSRVSTPPTVTSAFL